MKAMILSAGYGKRLRPFTANCPKPLLKINQETLLSNTLKFLTKFGIKQVVVNVHYKSEMIIDYINKNKFDLDIKIINEEEKILDTGGGILNAIDNFSNESFLVINPDTLWNLNYIDELRAMEKNFFTYKQKCCLLVIDKSKSYDKNLKGDFNLKNSLINRSDKENLKYIYTGLQIIRSDIFSGLDSKIFSINKIWDKLIEKNELHGMASDTKFFHVSTAEIYSNLTKKNLNIV